MGTYAEVLRRCPEPAGAITTSEELLIGALLGMTFYQVAQGGRIIPIRMQGVDSWENAHMRTGGTYSTESGSEYDCWYGLNERGDTIFGCLADTNLDRKRGTRSNNHYMFVDEDKAVAYAAHSAIVWETFGKTDRGHTMGYHYVQN